MDVSVRVMRAFNALVYRREKMLLANEWLDANKKAVELVRKLVEGGRLRPADLILARTEIDDVLAQQGPARTALVAAANDLRRALGVVGGEFDVVDDLEKTLLAADPPALLEESRRHRPDLRAEKWPSRRQRPA